jgi:hypothetical protein
VFDSFTGDRILSPDAPSQSKEDRGQLFLSINHAIAVLFVECLIGPDPEGRFRQETNTHPENTHGSIFETVHHLLCNTTNVVTEVELFSSGNILCCESPLYASQRKGYLSGCVGQPIVELGERRVTF